MLECHFRYSWNFQYVLVHVFLLVWLFCPYFIHSLSAIYACSLVHPCSSLVSVSLLSRPTRALPHSLPRTTALLMHPQSPAAQLCPHLKPHQSRAPPPSSWSQAHTHANVTIPFPHPPATLHRCPCPQPCQAWVQDPSLPYPSPSSGIEHVA